MKDALFLAWRHLRHHRGRSALLIVALAIVTFLPLALDRLVDAGETALRARAESTPLVAGPAGSPLDVVLSALYFREPPAGSIALGAATAIGSDDLAEVVPLSLGFRAGAAPLVGTSLEYFRLRLLACADGRLFAVIGECVLGSAVAQRLALGPGDRLTSEPVNALSLAGAYPIRMGIVGVLAPTGGPDDEAVFTNLRTTWVIGGLGHGHADLAAARDPALVIGERDGVIQGSAKVVEYVELDGLNREAVHFHGDLATFPVTAAIVVPRTAKSRSILLGRADSGRLEVALFTPSIVVEHLLVEVFRVRRIMLAVLGVVAVAMGLLVAVVIALSVRIRAQEIETMRLVGCAPGRVGAILSLEIVLLLIGAGLIALVGSLAFLLSGDFAVGLFTS